MSNYRGNDGQCVNCGTASENKFCSMPCKLEYHNKKLRMADMPLSVLCLLAYGRRDCYYESVVLRDPYMVAPLVEVDGDGLCRLTAEGWRWLRYHYERDATRVVAMLAVSKPLRDVRYMVI